MLRLFLDVELRRSEFGIVCDVDRSLVEFLRVRGLNPRRRPERETVSRLGDETFLAKEIKRVGLCLFFATNFCFIALGMFGATSTLHECPIVFKTYAFSIALVA